MSTDQAVTEAEILAALDGGALTLDLLWEGLGVVAVGPTLSMLRLYEAGQIRFVGCKCKVELHDQSCVVELKRGAR